VVKAKIADSSSGITPDELWLDGHLAVLVKPDAGLIILWPFLPRFFRSLGLLEDKQFVDEAAAHRAAGLLQYLADGQPEAPEYLLIFNKILCGLPWDEVLGFGDPIKGD